MKILFAAPITFDRITFFISQYFIGLAKAARQLGHEVRVVQTTENMYNPYLWKFLEREFNTFRKYLKPFVDLPHDLLLIRQIFYEVTNFNPDILFIHLIDTFFSPLVMQKIRNRGVHTFVWLGIHPSQVSSGIHRLARASDYTLSYDQDYEDYYKKNLNVNNLRIIPLGCDVDYYESIIPDQTFTKEHNSDICFIGLFDRHREIYLKALSEFNLGIWCWNIDDFNTPLKKFYKGIAFGESMIKIIKSSKIALNIHRDFEISGGNYRLFEIAACKTFQLVDEKKDMGKYFKIGKEIVTFSNENDLKEKVEYYLNHPKEREEIANAAYNRVKHDHTLVQRMSKITKLINSS